MKKKAEFTYAQLLAAHKRLKDNEIVYSYDGMAEKIRGHLLRHAVVTVHLWSKEERRGVRGCLSGVELGRVEFVVKPFTWAVPV